MNFRSIMSTPPGGEWFFEHGGERVSAPTWFTFLPKLKGLMARHGLKGAPLDVAAAYMCPHMPSWFCDAGGVKVTSSERARENARQYFRMHVSNPRDIAARLAACAACPMHRRTVCLTCTGVIDWTVRSFGGRRPRLPEDRMSGMCGCAETYESVVASVDPRELPVWDGVPGSCWRNGT